MSDKLKTNLHAISLAIGIVIAVFALVQAWAILPYRVQQTESEVKAMKDERKSDHEILVRIEEQVKALREELRRK